MFVIMSLLWLVESVIILTEIAVMLSKSVLPKLADVVSGKKCLLLVVDYITVLSRVYDHNK